ncbi:MAG: hypothetical protein P3X24_007850 [bacterium]|nr:hypothetical protein [bacterium]
MVTIANAVNIVSATELHLDERYYPRAGCDHVWAYELAEKLRAGAEFPPLLVDVNRMVILDGWHRYHAYTRVMGKDAQIPVQFVYADTEQELYLVALQANARHGRPYSTQDKACAVMRAEELGISRPTVSQILANRVETVENIAIRRIAYEADTGKPVILGRSWEAYGGKVVPKQIAAQIKPSEGRNFTQLLKLVSKLVQYLPDEEISANRLLLQELKTAIDARLP